jgi:hypothetical protein
LFRTRRNTGEKITTFKLRHPVLTVAYDGARSPNICQNGVNFLRRLALQEKNLITRVSMLLKSRASPDMLSFSLCNKRHEQTPLSNNTIDYVLGHREVSPAKDLSVPPRMVSNQTKNYSLHLTEFSQCIYF